MKPSDVIKNRALYYGEIQRTDHLYIVTQEPAPPGDVVNIKVNLDDSAAVCDGHQNEYPNQPYTDKDINTPNQGKERPPFWLLSGGALVSDDRQRVAIGLRDGNPTKDAFAFTNIGAGRCDRPLKEHCLEELATEFILCVLENGDWYQCRFGTNTQSLHALQKPAIRKKIERVLSSIDKNKGIKEMDVDQLIGDPVEESQLPKEINITWIDGENQIKEKLPGYVYLNNGEQTTEFRLAVTIDLSSYSMFEVFYGEGTGYACWKNLQQIAALLDAEKTWGDELLTPFLRELVRSKTGLKSQKL